MPFRFTASFALSACAFFVISISPIVVRAYVSPGHPTGYVNDFVHVLPAAEAQALESKLASLKAATGDEVAVVTVPSLGGDTIENYAVKLFQEWGIGGKDSDSGLLILVSSGDHEARIEVGYGLEGTVTDLQAGNIVRNVMIPAFKNDDYAGGISGGVDAVSQILTGSADAEQYSAPSGNGSPSSSKDIWGGIFFILFIAFNFLSRILGRSRSWWLGGLLGAGAGAIVGLIWGFFIGLIAVIVLTIVGLIFDFLVSRGGGPGGSGRSGGSLWPLLWLFNNRRGGSSGGSGGGGFGGFGGGSSGGGGASGSW
ncbi:MAG: methanol dehydrogenase-like protein [Candidatus Parcubacteria bacterium]|nr:methanol dehydrogenase-like protein [Candidatus Parcubacteria bacterium]